MREQAHAPLWITVPSGFFSFEEYNFCENRLAVFTLCIIATVALVIVVVITVANISTQSQNQNILVMERNKFKREFSQFKRFHSQEDNYKYEPNQKKQCFDSKNSGNKHNYNNRTRNTYGGDKKNAKQKNRNSNSSLEDSIAYYEKIMESLKYELQSEENDMFAYNVLQESEAKEVELCCHSRSSYCIELLLAKCKDSNIMKRFMSAFAENKTTVCTSAYASHITEALIYYAVKVIQNWSMVLNSEDNEEKVIVAFCLKWIIDFGEFVIDHFDDCLFNSYSCHVTCILIRALAGDLSRTTQFMSKNLKAHRQELELQYTGKFTSSLEQNSMILKEVPKFFKKTLKKLYKSFVKSEVVLDSLIRCSSAVVIEALLFSLKKCLPKYCNKMIAKLAEILFSEKNDNDIPVTLLHKDCSFVVDEMFKVADDELQLLLWQHYIVSCLRMLVVDSVGNFVIQRIFDFIQNKSVFESVCENIWPVFDEILKSQNYGIFVSLANACNRLSAQQAPFMKNIMMCLHCFEPAERQSEVLKLLLGFQRYENYISSGQSHLTLCLQGSLVAQAVLKFHKPLKVVHSLLTMAPTEIEFVAGHIQGCHVLNAFFGSISVGEKSKEKLLSHIKTVIISIACDRQKSLTLSRIWVLLSIKLKENIARELVQHKETLNSSINGRSIWMKFGLHHFKHLQKWREIQMNISHKNKS